MKKSFTLIEILVYITVLVIIITTVFSFIIWTIHSNSKTKAMRETLDNSRRAMEIITAEIREAKSIYVPTSIFDSHPGQLSLETSKYLPVGETISYLDFYLCDSHLCLKKEFQSSLVLTSDRVKVTNLVFRQIGSTIPSIQIDLRIEFLDITGRPERQAVVDTTSTASLRSY